MNRDVSKYIASSQSLSLPYDSHHESLIRSGLEVIRKCGDTHAITRETEAMTFVKKHTNTPIPSVLETQIGKYDSSFLMEFLPGERLDRAWPLMSLEARETTQVHLKSCFDELRALPQPNAGWIGSCNRGPAYDHRLNNGIRCGPFDSEYDFNEFLVKPVSRCPIPDRVERYRQSLSAGHAITFTHADICYTNILVDQDTGHVTGILDWEMAGWWPEYWEYNKALFGFRQAKWWVDLMHGVLKPYRKEWELDSELQNY